MSLMRKTSVLLLLIAALYCAGCPSRGQQARAGSQGGEPSSPQSTSPSSQQSAARPLPVQRRQVPVPQLQVVLPQTKLVLGQTMKVQLKNISQRDYLYRFPGGNNGCVLPIYRLVLIHASGRRYKARPDGPGQICTMVIVPPQTITLKPGGSRVLTLRTDVRWWYKTSKSLLAEPKSSALPLGRYRVEVRGAGLAVTTPGLEVVAK